MHNQCYCVDHHSLLIHCIVYYDLINWLQSCSLIEKKEKPCTTVCLAFAHCYFVKLNQKMSF